MGEVAPYTGDTYSSPYTYDTTQELFHYDDPVLSVDSVIDNDAWMAGYGEEQALATWNPQVRTTVVLPSPAVVQG